jgi:hypothetical protein
MAQQWLSYVSRAAGTVGILTGAITGELIEGGAYAQSRTRRFIAGMTPSANSLSIFPKNSVLLAFLTTEARPR